MAATTASTDMMTDEVLLRASYEGNAQAFEQIFLRHYSRIYRVAIRIVGNHEDAEEVAMDTFTRLHRNGLDPERAENVAGWLYRSAANASFNVVRSRNRRHSWWRRLVTREGRVQHEEDPADATIRGEAASQVRDALTNLPERQRNAVVLRAAGLTYAEIAAAIEVSPASVGTLVARGERKLREILMNETRAG